MLPAPEKTSVRFFPSMNAWVSWRFALAGRLRTARRSPRPSSEIRSTRRDRPVTSATSSCPKWWRIWSRAAPIGGMLASFSTRASRRSTASWDRTGLPFWSRAGRVWRLPSSSSYSSWRFTGNACIR